MPAQCAYMQPTQLINNCPQIAQEFTTVIDATCLDSLYKVCHRSFDENPPFSCSKTRRTDLLTAISNSLASANFLWGVLSFTIGAYLASKFPNYASFDGKNKSGINVEEVGCSQGMKQLEINHEGQGCASGTSRDLESIQGKDLKDLSSKANSASSPLSTKRTSNPLVPGFIPAK